MIKAIFFDIDGTLVSFDTHEVPENIFPALYKLKEKGIKLIIATGRGKDGLDVLKNFPFDGYITLNGQFCYTTDGEVIYENTILKEDLEILLKETEENPIPCGYVMRDTKVFNFRNELVDAIHAITLNDDHPAGDVSNVINEKIYQVMVFADEEKEKELLSHMKNCTGARWHPTFFDLSPIGGTKVKGIDRFLDYFGISLEETMSFGDGGNDLQMLEHTAVSVAMKAAPERLKAVADFVTDDPDNDGIIKGLAYYGLLE